MASRGKVFVRDATGLAREIGPVSALIGNIMVMGLGYVLVYAFFASLLYPGVNLPLTVVFSLLPGLLYSAIYYLLTVAMPRTGGDYVWISRVINAPLGFVANLLITFALITTNGVVAAWIVLYGLAPMFAGVGLVTSNTGLVNLAVTVSTLPTSFVISVVLMSIFIIPLFLATKNIFRVLGVMFVLALITTLVLVFGFFAVPNSTYITNFNALSGMDYSKTITTAAIPTGFTLGATLTGSIFTITNFLGFNYSAYYTGEVSQVRKSQFVAMFGSVIIFAAVLYLVYASAYYSVGADFLNAMSYLAATGSSSYTLPAAPVLNYLLTFATENPLVIVAGNLSLIITSLASVIAFTFTCVRNVFAWSFDRILPSGLTKMDQKRGSPYVAVIVLWVVSVISVALYYYTVFFQYFIYSALMAFITFGVASVAAALFPYWKKRFFEASPDIVRKKVAGIPLITILGVAGILLSIFLGYSTVQPAVTPPPSGPPLVQYLAYAIVPLTIIAGFVIYAVAAQFRKSQGLDLAMVFREIPPE